ncbi:MAG TPA: hypothetical protein VFW94_16120 [Candidatus Acidoferrales bacterium]|nr:hypothetical protein [Candidatus Acidoferrales bacterium]
MRALRPAVEELHPAARAPAADLAAGARSEGEAGTAGPAVAREAVGAGRVAAEGTAQGLAGMGLAVARTEAGAGRADTPVPALNDSIRLWAGWKELISPRKADFARRSTGSSELETQDLNAMASSRVAMVERNRWLRATWSGRRCPRRSAAFG